MLTVGAENKCDHHLGGGDLKMTGRVRKRGFFYGKNSGKMGSAERKRRKIKLSAICRDASGLLGLVGHAECVAGGFEEGLGPGVRPGTKAA